MGTKMGYANVAHVHVMPHAGQLLLTLMQGQFVPPKINVNPATGFLITLCAAQNVAVESFRFCKVASRNREVKCISLLSFFAPEKIL